MMRSIRWEHLFVVFAAAAALTGCGATALPGEDTVEGIQAQLTQENGGYQLTDEQPRFALSELSDAPVDLREMDDLPARPEAIDVDSALTPEPRDPQLVERCPHGFLRGGWREVGQGFGVYRGAMASPDGRVIGHFRGIYGRGQFLGKMILGDGRAHALMVGRYGNGKLVGHFFNRRGLEGTVHGFARDGRFRGMWRIDCADPR